MHPSHFDVFELKHVSLDEGTAYLLIGPSDEELVIVVCLWGEGGRTNTFCTDRHSLHTFSVSPVEK